MTRETKELITPLLHKKVVYNAKLNGFEHQQTQVALMGESKINFDSPEQMVVEAKNLIAYQSKLVELLVVSVDGQEADASKQVFEMDAKDFSAVVDALQESVKADDKDPKKKAS